MKIVIMRHGEAEARANSDRERQLTDSGRQQAQNAGHCLQQLKLTFEQLWVSPYCRARQTADEVLSVIGDVARHTKQWLVPESDPAEVVQNIDQAAPGSLLIVSHQPLVSALTGLIVEGDPRYGSPMMPASMACINTDAVLPGCGLMAWLRHAPNFEISE